MNDPVGSGHGSYNIGFSIDHIFSVFYIQEKGAARPAIRACGLDLLCGMASAGACRGLFSKSASGAGRDALAAEQTVFGAKGLAESGVRLSVKTPAGHVYRALEHKVFADIDAPAAKYALVGIKRYERVVVLDREVPAFSFILARRDIIHISQFLQGAVTCFLTAHAVIGVVGQDEGKHRLSESG